jgi:hypothetical protein
MVGGRIEGPCPPYGLGVRPRGFRGSIGSAAIGSVVPGRVNLSARRSPTGRPIRRHEHAASADVLCLAGVGVEVGSKIDVHVEVRSSGTWPRLRRLEISGRRTGETERRAAPVSCRACCLNDRRPWVTAVLSVFRRFPQRPRAHWTNAFDRF